MEICTKEGRNNLKGNQASKQKRNHLLNVLDTVDVLKFKA